jgi:hypothetical protein
MLRRWLARLRSAAALPAAERREVARAQTALLAAQLRVWTRPAGRLLPLDATDAREAAIVHPPPCDRPPPHALARAVDRAAEAGLFRPACLVRALALQRMLASAGVGGARIRIGVRPEGTRLHAHAWVEVDGAALGNDGRRAPGFQPLQAAALAAPEAGP